jgi:hypothetical protein
MELIIMNCDAMLRLRTKGVFFFGLFFTILLVAFFLWPAEAEL